MLIVGIDEVGRGCLAGPLVSGAVVLDVDIAGIKDSKLLSRAQRNHYAEIIYKQALAIGVGWVSAAEIDQCGITGAVRLSMERALSKVKIKFDQIIIDGNYNFLADDPRTVTMIKADQFIPCVSAASIVAKVARDDWMSTVAANEFPQYGFEKHVGYGTKVHLEMLLRYGACSLHRKSFRPIRDDSRS